MTLIIKRLVLRDPDGSSPLCFVYVVRIDNSSDAPLVTDNQALNIGTDTGKERLQYCIEIVPIEQGFWEVPRPHCPSTKESSIQLSDCLPSPYRTGEKDEDANRVVRIRRGWVDKVDNNPFNCAILRAFVS